MRSGDERLEPGPSWIIMVGAGLCVLATAALWLPWWQSPRRIAILEGVAVRGAGEQWLGYEIAGAGRSAVVAVLVVLAVLAIVVARVGRTGWAEGLAPVLVAAAGAAIASTAVASLTSWGRGAAWGAVAALVLGLGAAATAVVGAVRATGPVRWVTLAGLAMGLLVLVVPAPTFGRSVAGNRPGPYVHLAELRDVPFRSGVRGVRASSHRLDLTVIDGQAVVASSDGLITVDENGRADVLARLSSDISDRVSDNPILGVTGDRVVHWIEFGELVVTSLTPGSAFNAIVTGVDEASRVGVDGSVWLRAFGDESGTFRRLDVARVDGGETIDASDLPVVELDPSFGVDAPELVPAEGSALTVHDDSRGGNQLMRVGAATETLAGGIDPACGLVSDSRASHMWSVWPTTLTPDDAGGVWFVINAQVDDTEPVIAHVDGGGVLQAVAAPAPGQVTAMTLDGSGSLVLAVSGTDDRPGGELWTLPDAAGHLDDLPSPGADCVAEPPPVGPPVTLTRVAEVTGGLRIPLGANGRWADAAGGELFVVDPNGDRVSVGPRRDGHVGVVVPDGSGGMWWTEVPRGTDRESTYQLVHGRPGESQERLAPVPGIDDYSGTVLIADLTGAPSLLGTQDGAFELVDGRARQVFDGPVSGGIIGPDGRGWLLSDGRLLSFDGENSRPVIDAAEADAASVSVQLARGVSPEQLSLPRARLGLDADGRPLLVSDDVVLTVTDDGAVRVVAQDDRLLEAGVWPVEGGTVVSYGEGGHFRLDVDTP